MQISSFSVECHPLSSLNYHFIHEPQRKEEGDLPFGMEDLRYYMRKAEERKIDVDFGVVKQFFPVNLVLSGILKIFQDLFGNFDFLNSILFISWF